MPSRLLYAFRALRPARSRRTLHAPLSLLLPFIAASALAGPRIDGVAAVVDDDVILISEVDAAAARAKERLAQRAPGPVPPDVLREIRIQAVETLIAEQLILNFARDRGLEATAEDIDSAIQGIAVQEGVEVDAIYAAVAEQGMQREVYREELGRQITRMKTINAAVRSRITVPEEEVRQLYDERYGDAQDGMHAEIRHILVPWPDPESGEPRSASLDVTMQIVTRVEAGENFALLAQQYSAAPSAAEGGRTLLRQGEANPDLERYAFTLDPGDVSPPIETAHGYNLVQVLQRFDPKSVSYAQAEPELRMELIERKLEPEVAEWVEKMREQVYVQVVAPDLR